MYCNYNIKLFKPFNSMKKKIEPQLSDDWEIILDVYRTNAGFILYSKKLGQKVADIDLRRFLQFSKEYNLVIDSLKLQGTFIIGNDRSVYTEEMYNTWKEKYDKRTKTLIDKKDLIPGAEYETPCGSHFIYIGNFYLINFKKGYKICNYSLDNLTKIKSVHLISNKDGTIINFLKQKVRKLVNENIHSQEKLEDLVEYYRTNEDVAYLGKEKITPKKFNFREVHPKYTKNYNEKAYPEFAEILYNNEKMIIFRPIVKDLSKLYELEMKKHLESPSHFSKPHYTEEVRVYLTNKNVINADTLECDKTKFKKSYYDKSPAKYGEYIRTLTLEVIG